MRRPLLRDQFAEVIRRAQGDPATAFPHMNKHYDVIIVGGGPVGTALAVDLGLRGLHCDRRVLLAYSR